MNKKSAGSMVYIIFFLVIFLAFSAFAVDGTIVFTNRMKLQNITEATALAAAAEFNYSSVATSSDIEQRVSDAAEDIFEILKKDSLLPAQINVNVNTTSNKVLIQTNVISRPFFLAFLGVTGIKLESKACAVSEILPISASYAGINWLSAKAAYLSDILSKDLNLNDTAILKPLGEFASASYDLVTGFVNFGLINTQDNEPLSLGPGGFVTIKLPTPIIDKPGYDLFIKEIGSLEGYFVFAGLDNNPENPYVRVDDLGEGISWINISCSGTPEVADGGGLLGTYSVSTEIGNHDKFYGSGYFDLGASCVGGISMAKYIRIVDDNSESAFVTTDNTNYYKAMLYGEASCATAGADIDSVSVLNHVKLISASSF
jgi:hypothetical protein